MPDGVCQMKMKRNHVLDGLLGACVGDALGVPVEFTPRAALEASPVTDMLGMRTPHYQVTGTWSDDSSLMFCLAESLCHGFDLRDIADRICRWYHENYWTPHGNVFDVGGTTRMAILRLRQGVEPTKAGATGENDNGNGSLMRILPLAYYLQKIHDAEARVMCVHDVSAITHAHPRSKIACSIYIQVALNLLDGATPRAAYQQMQATIPVFYRNSPHQHELSAFQRLLAQDISAVAKNDIRSSGYVVHTLEASLWCLLNYASYQDTVLAAVNLGDDTDTTGAVAGGLAGIYYGVEAIPESWKARLARKDEIVDLANRLWASLEQTA